MTNFARRNTMADPDATRILPVMTAKEVRRRRREGEGWTLPGSGINVKIRRPGLRTMVTKAGSVPNGLSQRAIQFLVKNTAGQSLLENEKKSDTQLLQEYNLETAVLDELCTHIFVSPKYVIDREVNEDANEIGPEDITDFDKSWLVYRFTMGAVEDIERFRFVESDGDNGRHSETVWQQEPIADLT